jgi:hypothetical protein
MTKVAMSHLEVSVESHIVDCCHAGAAGTSIALPGLALTPSKRDTLNV